MHETGEVERWKYTVVLFLVHESAQFEISCSRCDSFRE